VQRLLAALVALPGRGGPAGFRDPDPGPQADKAEPGLFYLFVLQRLRDEQLSVPPGKRQRASGGGR